MCLLAIEFAYSLRRPNWQRRLRQMHCCQLGRSQVQAPVPLPVLLGVGTVDSCLHVHPVYYPAHLCLVIYVGLQIQAPSDAGGVRGVHMGLIEVLHYIIPR